MHSAIAISALLGAGAFAHPSFQHRHNHHKRDTIVTSTVGEDVMVEVIDLITVTVTAGQLPTSQPSVALAIPEKLAVNAPPAAPPSVTPIASPSQTLQVEASPSSSTPAVASSPAPAPVASSPEHSDTSWATSPLSPLGGGPGAKDILSQANYWRKQWKGLPPFTWSSVLANNSYMTATQPTYNKPELNKATGMYEDVPHNEGGAMNMKGHELYAGSSSQCIASGDGTTVTQQGLTPFDKAFLMWICELPNSNIQEQCKWISDGYQITSTGHASIIGGTVSQIGCYYMNSVVNSGFTGMWTCDFA